jgi:hypothetical protein
MVFFFTSVLLFVIYSIATYSEQVLCPIRKVADATYLGRLRRGMIAKALLDSGITIPSGL